VVSSGHGLDDDVFVREAASIPRSNSVRIVVAAKLNVLNSRTMTMFVCDLPLPSEQAEAIFSCIFDKQARLEFARRKISKFRIFLDEG
jgi:hypothetical protein